MGDIAFMYFTKKKNFMLFGWETHALIYGNFFLKFTPYE